MGFFFAGHRETDRLLIYSRDGSLIKNYGLKDLLTEEELSKVSHIQWMGYDKPNERWYWLNEDGSALKFLTMTKRKVKVPLNRPVVKTERSQE